jgi:hydrogenase maturation factor HypE
MLDKETLDTYVRMSQSTLEDQELLSGIILNNIDNFDISEIVLLYWTLFNNSSTLFKNIDKTSVIWENINHVDTFHFEEILAVGGYLKYIPFNNYPQAHKQIKQVINKNPQLWEQLKKQLKG